MLSTTTLVFEINLTRLFSISQFYHFAFMIVSLALLGTGASGTFLMLIPGKKGDVDQKLRTLSFGTVVSIMASYLVINQLPFDSFTISWDSRQIGYLAINFLALTLPFFFTGMAVGLLLNTFPEQAEKVYAVNLFGAAVGCVVALFVPQFVGGEGVVVFSAVIAAISAVIPFRFKGIHFSQKLVLGFSVGIFIFGVYEINARAIKSFPAIFPDLNLSPYKSLSYALQYPDAEIISQEWNSFSRVDVVSSSSLRSLPGISFRYFQPPPPEQGLFIDGDNLNPIVLEGANMDFTAYLPSALAYQLQPNANTLILEPRGGIEVLIAINEGAQTINVVEENELIVSSVPYIYNFPGLSLNIESDRSFLRSDQEQYEVIVLPMVETYHPVGSGAYSLGEDYSFTLEAFQEILSRLSTDGVFVVTRWLQMPPSEWLRTFILAASALESRGDDPRQNIVALRSFNTGVLFIKVSPFTRDELEIVRDFARERAYDLVLLPDIRSEEVNRYAVLQEPVYFDTFADYLSTNSTDDWLSSYPYDVSPPTDDHPFYGHYFKWSQTGQIIAELGKTWQPFGGAGYLVVLILLALALVVSITLILLPLVIGSRITSRVTFPQLSLRGVLAPIIYFGLIGFAYMFVEIPFFQNFILFLGQPTYALTIVLFSILLFSGVGSHFSPKLNHRISMLVLVFLVFLISWLFPAIVEVSLGFSFGIRVMITVALLAPLGILMGVPFPSGIRIIQQTAPQLIPWVWGINGAASVISSILSMLLALSFGLKMVLVTGALCYAGAWFILPQLRLGR